MDILLIGDFTVIHPIYDIYKAEVEGLERFITDSAGYPEAKAEAKRRCEQYRNIIKAIEEKYRDDFCDYYNY